MLGGVTGVGEVWVQLFSFFCCLFLYFPDIRALRFSIIFPLSLFLKRKTQEVQPERTSWISRPGGCMIHPFISVILLDHLLCAGPVLGTGA